ncbi:MAG: hypothetical protein Q9195_006483 [Heterodermia aff. obscurata]
MTAIQIPNSQDIRQKMWHNRHRIKDAYLRDQRYDHIGKSLAYCPWNVCLMDETKTHAHLHRTGSTCEWTGCDKTEVHLHKYKPPPLGPPEDIDFTGRYERVKDIMKEILGEQYQEEPLTKNIFLELEDERKAEEAEKERKAKRLADAERAGDEAKREFEQAAAERRARRVDDRKKAREIDQALERKRLERRAAKAQLLFEADTGNELERTGTYPDSNVQPQVSHLHRPQNQIIGSDDSVVEANATPRKRKRVDSPISQGSSSPNASPTDPKAAKSNKLIDDEGYPDSEASDVTLYTLDQLDAILEGAEIVRHDPNSLPFHTLEVAELAPDMVIEQELLSNYSDAQVTSRPFMGHSDTAPTSADDEIQPQNGSFLGSMQPLPSPPRQTELSKEETDMEEQLARRRQIQWVLKDRKYPKSQREKWAAIHIYEDSEDSIDEVM